MKNEDMIAEIAARAKHIQETNGRYTAFEIFQSKWYARVLFDTKHRLNYRQNQ